MTDAAKLIDTQRYPIFPTTDHSSQEFYHSCRKSYERDGVLMLPGFLQAAALERMAAQAREVEHLSYKQTKHHNVYLADKDPNHGDDHPRNRLLTTTNSTIADADIQSDAALRTLYHCEAIHRFIAHVSGKAGIYPYVDALSPLNIGVTRENETLAWHFDRSEFATTLALQTPEGGGEFEYVAETRSEGDPAYDQVEKLFDGDTGDVKSLDISAGTLCLFKGRHSIHRVAPVKGARTRIIAILTYDEKPNQRMNAFTQKKFYGRAA